MAVGKPLCRDTGGERVPITMAVKPKLLKPTCRIDFYKVKGLFQGGEVVSDSRFEAELNLCGKKSC